MIFYPYLQCKDKIADGKDNRHGKYDGTNLGVRIEPVLNQTAVDVHPLLDRELCWPDHGAVLARPLRTAPHAVALAIYLYVVEVHLPNIFVGEAMILPSDIDV